MEIIDHINRAIEYIELNLHCPLTVDAVARSVGYSRFHLVRLFHTVTGETVNSYIRKRRLHEAGRELLNSKGSILDIALTYQYQSHEAFSRSFKNAYKCSPSTYRKRQNHRQYFPRLTLRTPALFLLSERKSPILPICLHMNLMRLNKQNMRYQLDRVYIHWA